MYRIKNEKLTMAEGHLIIDLNVHSDWWMCNAQCGHDYSFMIDIQGDKYTVKGGHGDVQDRLIVCWRVSYTGYWRANELI